MGGCVRSQTVPQALARLAGQLLVLAPALGRRKARQDGVALAHHEGAPTGDVHRVVARLGQVGEQGAHVGGRLEPVLGRDPAPFILADKGAIGDAQQGFMRRVEVCSGEIDVVGRHKRDVMAVGVGDQARLRRRLAGETVPLELDVEPVAKGLGHGRQGRVALGVAPGREQGIHRPVSPAGQQDQPLRPRGHFGPFDGGLLKAVRLQEGHGGQGGKVEIARL